MSDKEQAMTMISVYMNLLRIKTAKEKDIEIENQLCEAKAKLQALGVVVEDLVIRQE